MCDPMTMSALAAASAVTKAYGAISQSQSEASALKANARGDLAQGYQNELDSRDKARVDLAAQLHALGGRGIDLSTGTPLDLLRASARHQEIDALRLRAEGQNRYNAQRAQASSVLKNGWITAGGELLMGAANASKLGGLGGMFGGKAPLTATNNWAGGASPALNIG